MSAIIKDYLFPFPELSKATKSIDQKIDSLIKPKPNKPYKYEYASANEKLEINILMDTLKETIENKKILEDKAKSSLIAITISSTLIFNIVKFMQDSNNSITVLVLLAIFSFFSLIYMVIAGVLSLYSISEINKVSIMFPEDYLLDEQEKKVQVADNIEYNYLHNLKRNNFMTTSYKCMITSISFLIAIFIVSTIISFQGHSKKEELQTLKNELKVISTRISTLHSDSTADRQSIVNIQQTLIKLINDKRTSEHKLDAIRISVEQINRIIDKNPEIFSNDIKKILLELRENINNK